MSNAKFLAVHGEGLTFIEDSVAQVARVLASENPQITYYRIDVDADTQVPSLVGPVTVSNAPRVLVARTERVALSDGKSEFGEAEIEARLDAE